MAGRNRPVSQPRPRRGRGRPARSRMHASFASWLSIRASAASTAFAGVQFTGFRKARDNSEMDSSEIGRSLISVMELSAFLVRALFGSLCGCDGVEWFGQGLQFDRKFALRPQYIAWIDGQRTTWPSSDFHEQRARTTMDARRVTDELSVAPQISATDVADIADAGFALDPVQPARWRIDRASRTLPRSRRPPRQPVVEIVWQPIISGAISDAGWRAIRRHRCRACRNRCSPIVAAAPAARPYGRLSQAKAAVFR